MKSFEQRHDARLLFVLILVVCAATAVILLAYDQYSLIYYGDANSRMVQTRLIVDSDNPGLHRIGTVWLPLPQLIILPLTLIGVLYWTGLAATIVNSVCLALSAAIIYKAIYGLSGSRAAAVFSSLGYALNPNLMYISLTAMTETMTLLFIVAGFYFFTKLIIIESNQATNRNTAFAAASLAAATLCRYEAWPLAVFFVAVLVFKVIINKTNSKIQAVHIAIAAIALAGILFWLLWNWLQFGNPFYFSNAEYYSAAWQAKNRNVRDGLYLQFGRVLSVWGITINAIFGPVLLLLCLTGLWLSFRYLRRSDNILMIAFLSIMPLFTVVSLFMGVAEMTLWWNSRYVLLLSPLVAVMGGFTLAEFGKEKKKHFATIGFAIIILHFIYQIALSPYKVVTYADAHGGFKYKQTPFAVDCGVVLKNRFKVDKILMLTGSGQAQRIIQTSRIPTKAFTVAINGDIAEIAHSFSSQPYSIVVFSKEPDFDCTRAMEFGFARFISIHFGYEKAYENQYYIVYEKKMSEI